MGLTANLKSKLHCFLMGDVYPFVEHYVTTLRRCWKKVTSHALPYVLNKVTLVTENGTRIDITDLYIRGKKWYKQEYGYSLVYVDWEFDQKPYKYVFAHDQPIHFPPYTMEHIRSPTRNKVAAISVDGDFQQSAHDELMMYAGPKHNFYSDICKMLVSWVAPLVDSVEITNMRAQTTKFSQDDELKN